MKKIRNIALTAMFTACVLFAASAEENAKRGPGKEQKGRPEMVEVTGKVTSSSSSASIETSDGTVQLKVMEAPDKENGNAKNAKSKDEKRAMPQEKGKGGPDGKMSKANGPKANNAKGNNAKGNNAKGNSPKGGKNGGKGPDCKKDGRGPKPFTSSDLEALNGQEATLLGFYDKDNNFIIIGNKADFKEPPAKPEEE